MSKIYPEITRDLSQSLKIRRQEIPETMQAFTALALGVAARCDSCLGFHNDALVKAGATRQEVLETLAMAVYMGGGPSLMYVANAQGLRTVSGENSRGLKLIPDFLFSRAGLGIHSRVPGSECHK